MARSITVRGALDIDTAPELQRTLDEAFDDGALLLVVDMQDVGFLDSSGLRVLVFAAERAEREGGRLFVSGMSPAAERVLEVSGLIERLRQEAANDTDS